MFNERSQAQDNKHVWLHLYEVSKQARLIVFELHIEPRIISGDRGWNSGYFWVKENINWGAQRGILVASNFLYLYMEGITQLHTDVNIHQIGYWTYAHLLYMLYLNLFKNSHSSKSLGISIGNSSHGSAMCDSWQSIVHLTGSLFHVVNLKSLSLLKSINSKCLRVSSVFRFASNTVSIHANWSFTDFHQNLTWAYLFNPYLERLEGLKGLFYTNRRY